MATMEFNCRTVAIFSGSVSKLLPQKIEAEIEDPESQFWQLFRPAKDLFTGRSYYTNVLWALEKLVWFDDYVIRAIELLAKINEKQFQYKLANTPIIRCIQYFVFGTHRVV